MGGEEAGQPPIAIAVCSETDVEYIARILEEAPEAARWSERGVRESLTSTGSTFLLARVRGEVAGFIVGRVIGAEAEILNLAVKRSRRRQRVGQTLAVALLAGYEEEGIRRVFLEVRESNGAAITFYEGLGFRQVGTRPDYYRNPEEAALILARESCSES